MEDTDFRELGRQLLTEFGGIHQRVSRFVDKALSGEMAVMLRPHARWRFAHAERTR